MIVACSGIILERHLAQDGSYRHSRHSDIEALSVFLLCVCHVFLSLGRVSAAGRTLERKLEVDSFAENLGRRPCSGLPRGRSNDHGETKKDAKCESMPDGKVAIRHIPPGIPQQLFTIGDSAPIFAMARRIADANSKVGRFLGKYAARCREGRHRSRRQFMR